MTEYRQYTYFDAPISFDTNIFLSIVHFSNCISQYSSIFAKGHFTSFISQATFVASQNLHQSNVGGAIFLHVFATSLRRACFSECLAYSSQVFDIQFLENDVTSSPNSVDTVCLSDNGEDGKHVIYRVCDGAAEVTNINSTRNVCSGGSGLHVLTRITPTMLKFATVFDIASAICVNMEGPIACTMQYANFVDCASNILVQTMSSTQHYLQSCVFLQSYAYFCCQAESQLLIQDCSFEGSFTVSGNAVSQNCLTGVVIATHLVSTAQCHQFTLAFTEITAFIHHFWILCFGVFMYSVSET